MACGGSHGGGGNELYAVVNGEEIQFTDGVDARVDSTKGEIVIDGSWGSDRDVADSGVSLQVIVKLADVATAPRGVPLTIDGALTYGESAFGEPPKSTFAAAAGHSPAIAYVEIRAICYCGTAAGTQRSKGTVTITSPVGQPLEGAFHLEVDQWQPPRSEPVVVDAVFRAKK